VTILDPEKPAHAAADGRLRAEPIAWLTSTRTGSGSADPRPDLVARPLVTLA
jgi:hypothetical protein